MEDKDIIYVPASVLENFMRDVLVRAGVPEDDAKICAAVLIESDKRGIDSHGINRLKPIYIDRIKDGILNPVTEYEIVREAPATAVIDGHNGMGHVIAYNSMKLAIEKAEKYGIGMVAVRNSTHYGIAGYYGLMAAEHNMIGVTGTNARPSIAPTFGIESMLGTNPLTFVMPTDEKFPFFLDCATSVSQRGKVEYYARKGQKIPEGWVIDSEGNTLTDAVSILTDLTSGRASMTPLGGVGEETAGYKGYGYATVVEILSAALQSGSYLKMLLGVQDGRKVPYALGHFFIAINIAAFTDPDDFKKTTGNILRELRNSKRMPGKERIYTAGEKEYINLEARKVTGIPVNNQLFKELKQLAADFNIDTYDFLNM